jgi:MFS family permease
MKSEPQIRFSRALLVIIIFIDMMAFTVILPVMPDLMHYYFTETRMPEFLVSGAAFLNDPRTGQSGSEVMLGGFIISIWALMQFFFMPFWGRLSDRTGRKKILIITASGQVVASLIWAFAVTLPYFLIYRILGGVMSGNISVAYAAMADISEKRDRTKYMGMLGAAGGIGMIAGPVAGGMLTHPSIQNILAGHPSLHPFSACAFAGVILFILNTVLMFKFRDTKIISADISSPENIPPDLPLLSLSFRPNFYLPGFARLASLNFLFCFSLAGIELILPYFLKSRLGSTAAVIGFIFLFIGITMAIGQSMLIPFLLKRISEKSIAFLGFGLIPVPLLIIAFFVNSYTFTIINIIPVVIGIAVIGPSLSGMVSHLAPASKQGYILGLFSSYGSLAYAAGPVLTAVIYGIGGVYAACSWISLLTLMSLVILKRLNQVRV